MAGGAAAAIGQDPAELYTRFPTLETAIPRERARGGSGLPKSLQAPSATGTRVKFTSRW
jgi:hypothetical protein